MTAIERAKSLANPLIRLTLIPGAGWISKRVTTGPGRTSTTSALIPKSWSFNSNNLERCSKESALYPVTPFLSAGSSRLMGGSEPTTLLSSNSFCCCSRSTRGLCGVTCTAGCIAGGVLNCCFFTAVSTLTIRSATAALAFFLSSMRILR